jgi:hypothetical protein
MTFPRAGQAAGFLAEAIAPLHFFDIFSGAPSPRR